MKIEVSDLVLIQLTAPAAIDKIEIETGSAINKLSWKSKILIYRIKRMNKGHMQKNGYQFNIDYRLTTLRYCLAILNLAFFRLLEPFFFLLRSL